mgnify:CR=1 FL=1
MNTMLKKLIPILLLAGTFLSACSPTSPEAKSDQARVANPAVPAEQMEILVDGNNAFALDLYQSLRSSDGNLFYSPYSISLALGMTYGGARGVSEAQMADVLHFDLPQAELHPAFNRLDIDLEGSSEPENEDVQPMQLSIANAIWGQEGYPFLPEYLDLLALNYGAGINLADFTTRAEPTRKEINQWVSDQTEERIQDLLAPGVVDATTRMVLVNAIYFLADWEQQFDANNTYQVPFYLLDGTDVQVDMMSDQMALPYLRGENYQAVELPYAGGSAVMDIIMPDEGQLAAFESALDWSKLEGILSNLQGVDLRLRMPKFTFSSQFDLAKVLAGMGMPDAFCAGAADFSGMDGSGGLCISAVIHQAFVAVDEEGTEAAAATAVVMEEAAMIYNGLELTIDHPFFFLIRDLGSGQVLFVGRVLNPGQ